MRSLIKRLFCLFLLFLLILPFAVSCQSASDADAEFRDLCWAIDAGEPTALDFVVSMEDGANVEFAKKYDFDEENTEKEEN